MSNIKNAFKNGKAFIAFLTWELTINSADTIRQDPFFFTTEEGGLCFDYIWDLMDAEHDFIGDF